MVEIIEYVRRNRNNKGVKRGVMYCGLDPNDDNNVVVGFSLCNSIDRFDYIEGDRIPGFGLSIAKDRAWKWTDHTDYFIQNCFTEEQIENECELNFLINPNSSEIVEIPPSIQKKLRNFIERSMRYYKDKEFPEWAEKLIKYNEYQGEFTLKPIFIY